MGDTDEYRDREDGHEDEEENNDSVNMQIRMLCKIMKITGR
jgi:hypothetical protein